MLVTACKHLAHTLETDQVWPKLHESKNTAHSDGAKDPCLHQGAINTLGRPVQRLENMARRD